MSARILASSDHTSISVVIEMRTAEDRQRLEAIPEVRDTLHNLSGAYNVLVRLYQEIETFGAGAA